MKQNIKKPLIFIIPAILAFTAIHSQDTKTIKEPGINVSNMDLKVKPNQDFYKFVNGTWLEKTEIPADKTRWGSFDELRKKNRYRCTNNFGRSIEKS